MEKENLFEDENQQQVIVEPVKKEKKEKFSYSKIGVFEQCKYKYKLVYRDHHFIHDDSVATEFGTLIHYIEECMAKRITEEGSLDEIDYTEFRDMLYNLDRKTDEEIVVGVNILKQKYAADWMTLDKSGRTYDDKVKEYCNTGIYRLQDMLNKNKDLKIIGVEKEFEVDFRNYTFHGFIDRFFQDQATGHIYLEDIKSWAQPADSKTLTTPLQFVVYSLAIQQMLNISADQISCAYELPLCNIKQQAGTKGFMTRGIKKLNEIFDEIETGDFEPSPSPLCHWCIFSATKPNQPEEAKNLCPYYSHWTKQKKDFSVENTWMGPENHNEILNLFINKSNLTNQQKEQLFVNSSINLPTNLLATDSLHEISFKSDVGVDSIIKNSDRIWIFRRN